ncbi:MAG: hypothetical protein WA434_16560, partial [Candidatus Acidiferrales bacterium]
THQPAGAASAGGLFVFQEQSDLRIILSPPRRTKNLSSAGIRRENNWRQTKWNSISKRKMG